MAIRNAPSDRERLVQEGHMAAIRCVEVIEQLSAFILHEAELTPSVFIELLAKLYHGLRYGWWPISRCWPQLREPARDYPRILYLGNTERTSPVITLSPPVPPVTAWQTARQVFWLAVANSPLHDSAIQAWQAWSDDYRPSIEGNHFDAHEAFLVAVPVRFLLKNYPSLPWVDWRRSIDATEARSLDENRLSTIPGDAPGLPLAPKSLPKSRTARQRLVTRLDGLIDAADAGLRLHGDQFITQLESFRSHIAAPMADEPQPFVCSSLSQILPLWRELEEYLTLRRLVPRHGRFCLGCKNLKSRNTSKAASKSLRVDPGLRRKNFGIYSLVWRSIRFGGCGISFLRNWLPRSPPMSWKTT